MTLKLSSLMLLIMTFITSAFAHAAPRTVFIQMFEWPWNDVARECEIYLGPAGFSAVQVSPPHEHITVKDRNHPWWERYQVVSYKISSRGGTEKEFTDMIKACHKAGVEVYADAVINHAAGFDSGVGFAGTPFSLFDYPGTYSYNDFHHCGRNGNDWIVNYNDLYEMQNCMLVGLADLATGSNYVRKTLANYMNRLLDLGVDGFRIDAAKHVPAKDIAAIKALLKKDAYIYQEIIFNPVEGIRYSDYTPAGDVTAYSYPYSVGNAFKSKNTDGLYNITRDLPDSADSVVFLTNHDIERFPDQYSLLNYTSSRDLYLLAQIYMLAWPFGYPQVYSGYTFSSYDEGPPLQKDLRTKPILDENNRCRAPWTCEHRDRTLAAMVDFRNQTDKVFSLTNWWSNGRDQLAFGRGNLGYVVINSSSSELAKDFKTSLPAGQYCNMISKEYVVGTRSCPQTVSVDHQGILRTTVPAMSALVLMQSASSLKNKKSL